MSVGETQSRGCAGESLVRTGQTSCWNLWPGYHSLHPMLPAPACPSPPWLGCLSTAGQQLLQYHWWDNTPGQKTSPLLTKRAWSLMIPRAHPRLLVFPPLSTQRLGGQGNCMDSQDEAAEIPQPLAKWLCPRTLMFVNPSLRWFGPAFQLTNASKLDFLL